MDLDAETLKTFLQSGGTPIGAVIVFYLWRLSRQMQDLVTTNKVLIDFLAKNGLKIQTPATSE